MCFKETFTHICNHTIIAHIPCRTYCGTYHNIKTPTYNFCNKCLPTPETSDDDN